MNVPKLVKMANEIASFFEGEGEGDRDRTLAGIAGHLKRFWDPRMRTALLHHVDEDGGSGLKECVLASIKANRESLTPKAPSSPPRP